MDKLTPTKQKILKLLKRDHTSTIKDIVAHFVISEIAVRGHVNDLEQQDFIRRHSVKQKIGRPYYTYELTEKGHQTFPNQYEALPLELLRDLEELQGKEAVKDLLDKRMEREKSFFQSKIQSNDFDQKIAKIAAIQDEKGYMVEYEKTADGDYEVKNFNCPILNLASSYHQLCSNEKQVFFKYF